MTARPHRFQERGRYEITELECTRKGRERGTKARGDDKEGERTNNTHQHWKKKKNTKQTTAWFSVRLAQITIIARKHVHTAGAKDHVFEVGLATSTVTIVCQITAGAKDYISRYAAAVVHSNRKVQPLFEQSIQSDAGHFLVLLGHFTSKKTKKKKQGTILFVFVLIQSGYYAWNATKCANSIKRVLLILAVCSHWTPVPQTSFRQQWCQEKNKRTFCPSSKGIY